jgi:hypothetical protein
MLLTTARNKWQEKERCSKYAKAVNNVSLEFIIDN